MTTLASISAAGSRQVLVSGRVADAITGRGIDVITLTVDYDDGSGTFRSLPGRTARQPDGWFAYHLPSGALPAAIDPGPGPTIRVTAHAAGLDSASGTITPGLAAVEPVVESRTTAGHVVTVTRIRSAPFRVDLVLTPRPVALEGTVYVGGILDEPATGVTVKVSSPAGASAVTNDRGAFRIASLPIAQEVILRITRNGNAVDRPFHPDYGQRVNRAVFAIAP